MLTPSRVQRLSLCLQLFSPYISFTLLQKHSRLCPYRTPARVPDCIHFSIIWADRTYQWIKHCNSRRQQEVATSCQWARTWIHAGLDPTLCLILFDRASDISKSPIPEYAAHLRWSVMLETTLAFNLTFHSKSTEAFSPAFFFFYIRASLFALVI